MLHGTRVASDEAAFSFDLNNKVDSTASTGDLITVPDAHLLFSGDFQRSGSFDLKIVGEDGKSFLIEDYFRSDKRATLKSPEGATLTPDLVEALAGPLAPGQYAQAAQQPSDAQVIGRVATVTGSATVLRNGVVVTLNAGDAIVKGDVVQTGSGSTLGITFIDGSTFNLTAGARMVVNDLVYEQGGANNSALLSLVQGAANFVAGQIAKTGDMKVATPVATMGIRGTAVILDISSTDGRVSVSVIDQRDNQDHTVEMFAPNGTLLGIARSQGGTWVLVANATFGVLAQETGKTPQQIAQEFAAFQQLLNTYEAAKQLFPNLPEHTQVDPKGTQEAKGTQTPNPDQGGGGPKPGDGNNNPPPPGDGGTTGSGKGDPATDGDGNPNPSPGDGNPNGDSDPPPTFSGILGGGGNDELTGGSGQDFIYGFGGNDTITAEGGNDFVYAGLGDDTVVAGHGGGNDHYDGDSDGTPNSGGPGNDTITFTSTHDGVYVNLSGEDQTIEISEGEFVTVDAHSATGPEIGTDVVLNFENVTGGDGDDILIGTDGANIIDGYGGADGMFGGGGNDVFLVHDDASWFVQGGSGVDILRAVGSFDIRDGQDEGPHVENIEIIDLNTDGSNIVDIDAQGIAEMNCEGTIRVLGGGSGELSDHFNLTSDFFAQSYGRWQLVEDHVTYDPDGFTPAGTLFDKYEFVEYVGDAWVVRATAYVDEDIVTEVIEHVMAIVHTPDGYDVTTLDDDFRNASIIETDDEDSITFALGNKRFVVDGKNLDGHDGHLTAGRITGIKVFDISLDETLLFEATGFDISAVDLDAALNANNPAALDAIFSAVSYQATGNDGADVLVGGAFHDRLDGAGGNDTLTGNEGGDIFVYNGGNDTISDFSLAEGDRIDLTAFPVLQHMSNVGPRAQQIGNSIVIDLDNTIDWQGQTLTLDNFTSLNLMTDDDFIFGMDRGDPPVANDDIVNTTEDAAAIDIHVAQNDTDDQQVSLIATNISALSNPSLGTLQYISFGDFTFTPAPNAFGTTTFTYQAFDGQSYSNTATVTINIAAVDDATVEDRFNSQAYDLNDGSNNWAMNWTEANDDFSGALNGSPTAGEIFISHDSTTSLGNLQLTLTDNDLESDIADTIQRSVDLTGATSATLTFDYRRVDMENGDDIQIYASNGGNFQLIGEIEGNGLDDQTYQTFTFDLTPFISASANTTIQFAVDDRLEDGDTLYIDNVKIAYEQAENKAPVLDEDQTPVLSSVNEDAGVPVGPVGTPVSQLADLNPPAGGLDNVTDFDSAVTGIAIYGTNEAHGTWFYTIDGGSNWQPVESVSDGSALLLAADANTRLYFQPNPDFNGTINDVITFRAWDRTAGTNGEKFNIGAGGQNTTSVSSAPDTAAITVNAVNAPVVFTDDAMSQKVGDDGSPDIFVDLGASSASTVARLQDGSFVVVWNNLDGDQNHDLYARHFASNGKALDDPFLITSSAGHQTLNPSGGNVAVLPDNSLFVTYQDTSAGSVDVYGQYFNTSGPVGQPIPIAVASGEQSQPKVVALGNGDLFIFWTEPQSSTDADIFGRILDSDTGTLGSAFQINTLSGYAAEPSATLMDNGEVLVVWKNASTPGQEDVMARRFTPNGESADTYEYMINSTTDGLQVLAGVARLTDGSLVVTWTSNGNEQDEDGYGVFGQRLQYDGFTPIDGEFRISSTEGGDQLRSNVTALSDGGFVVTWENDPDVFGDAAFVAMQRFTIDDDEVIAVGQEVVVANNGRGPDVAALYDGSFAVTWLQTDPQHSPLGIRARVYDNSTNVTGLTLSDDDAGNSSLAVTVTAAHGTITPADDDIVDLDNSANTFQFSGTLNQINALLDEGIVYTPDGTSLTDQVTLTVDDGNGGVDLTNFIFAEYAPGGAMLNGTSGKDIIFATGEDDTLTGDSGADTFLFNFEFGFAFGQSQDLIWDFNVAEDKIRLDNFDDVPLGDDFSEGDLQAWISADGITQDELGAVISLGDGNMILLANVAVEDLRAANFVSHNNGGMVA